MKKSTSKKKARIELMKYYDLEIEEFINLKTQPKEKNHRKGPTICTCVASCHYWVSSVWSKMNIFDCIRSYSFLCNSSIFSIATKKWIISTAAKNMHFRSNWPNHPNSKSLQIHAHNMDPFRISTISRSVFFYD